MNKILIPSIAALFAGVVSMTGQAADMGVSAADAAETVAAEAASTGGFATIDANADGMISASEAEGNAALKTGWSSADTNQDGHLDAAEFSAFETGSTTDAPAAR